jgi:hypothetical protein
VASRQSAVREVQRNRRPGLDALGGEALAAVPAAMPESERARASRAQNRHGGAPRGERTDRKVRAAPEKRGNYKDYAPVGAPPSPRGVATRGRINSVQTRRGKESCRID